MNFNARVYEIVRQIPHGKVASYGQIAALCGNARASRAVGYALHHNPYPGEVPCHRVVFRDGSLPASYVFGGLDVQKRLLQSEGIQFTPDGRVRMDTYRWNGER